MSTERNRCDENIVIEDKGNKTGIGRGLSILGSWMFSRRLWRPADFVVAVCFLNMEVEAAGFRSYVLPSVGS